MKKDILSKHFAVAKMFIKLRWLAVLVLIVSFYIVKRIFWVSIQDYQLYIISIILLGFNILYFLFIWLIENGKFKNEIKKIRKFIHVQVSVDLIILTFILHYSGGVENPIIIYYIFHMIIVSMIFSPIESYLQTSFALLLVGVLALLECYSIIPHYPLYGFVSNNVYQNHFYIFTTGFIFVTTSFIVVALTNSIVLKSRKNEDALIKANHKLELNDKLKNEYVLRITHDMNGHLSAVSGCLSLVKNPKLGALNFEQEDFINRAYDRTTLLSNFVKDLLNLTKKRLERVNEMKEINIKEIISKVVSAVQVNANNKSITLDVDIDFSVNTIIGNKFSIEELFSNLLMNSIKYTPEKGNVKLIVKNASDHFICEVSDNGIGIPKEDLSKIFDEFYRASNVKHDINTGTGLGLSIVKQIITNHKGKIRVESKLGEGTKFIFTLPVNPHK